MTLIYFILGALFNSIAAYLVKLSFTNIESLNQILINGFNDDIKLALFGLFNFLLAFTFYGLVLSKVDLSVGQPIFTALSMIFVVLISIFVLNEPFSIKYFIGLLLIIIGITIVSQV